MDRRTDCAGSFARHDLSAIRRLVAGRLLNPRLAGERVPSLDEALHLAARRSLWPLVEVKKTFALRDRARFIDGRRW